MATTPAQKLFGAAEQAFLARKFGEARSLLLQLGPSKQPAVFRLRALVERELSNLAEARNQFEQAVALSPRDPQLWNGFGNLLSRLDDQAAALQAYDRALALSPRFADALFNRSRLFRRAGRFDEARIGYEAAIAQEPNQPRFWNGLADLERAAGNLATAASAYDRALAARADEPLNESPRRGQKAA